MEFIDNASIGKNSFLTYLTGAALIIGLFFLGNSLLFFDVISGFPNEQIENLSENRIVGLIGKTRFLFWLTVPFALVLGGILIHVRKVHQRPILSIFTSRTQLDWKRVLFSFLLLFGILSVSLWIQSWIMLDMNFQFDFNKFFPLLLIALLMIPLQTTCEEILFRSYLMQGLKLRLKSNKFAVIISGIMFGAIHVGNPEIQVIGYHILIYYFAVGIFLGIVALFDNGLELSIGYHAANNIFGAIVVTNDWQAFQTDAMFLDTTPPGNGIDILIGILVVLPTIFFIYHKKYNWHSLKEKWNA